MLRDALDDYLLDCSLKLSSDAMRWYTQKLERFVTEMEETPVTSATITGFLRRLQTTPSEKTGLLLSSNTVHGYAQVIKSFVRWCEQNHYLERAPRMSMPKVDQKVIEVFQPGQIKRMLAAAAQEETTALAHRDRALILFLLDTGVRANEACSLTMERLNLPQGYAKVIGKGRKEREVMFGEQTRVQLTRYVKRYRRGECANVFTGKKGHPLTVSGIDQMIYRLSEWAGIEGVRCSAHTFRHTMAVNYILSGGDLYALSRLLGHTSVSTTEIYLRAAKDRQLRRASVSLVDDLLQ